MCRQFQKGPGMLNMNDSIMNLSRSKIRSLTILSDLSSSSWIFANWQADAEPNFDQEVLKRIPTAYTIDSELANKRHEHVFMYAYSLEKNHIVVDNKL